jgi:hypothetical protein
VLQQWAREARSAHPPSRRPHIHQPDATPAKNHHQACEAGDDAAAARALAAGADPNACGPADSDHRTPLMLAAAAPGGAAGAAAHLLRRLAAVGARVRAATRGEGATALHAAAAAGNAEAAVCLLELGASATAADVFGRTPLHLLGSGGGGDGQGPAADTPASATAAATSSSTATPNALRRADADELIAGALVAAGADPSALDRGNRTPMAAACQTGSPSAVYALWRIGGQLPAHLTGKIAAGIMDLVQRELDAADGTLQPAVRRQRHAVAQLRTVLPGLQRLVLESCASLKRAESGGSEAAGLQGVAGGG